MSQTDRDLLEEALRRCWPGTAGDKVKRYVGQFFNGTWLGTKITAQVVGNHGTYYKEGQSVEAFIFAINFRRVKVKWYDGQQRWMELTSQTAVWYHPGKPVVWSVNPRPQRGV